MLSFMDGGGVDAEQWVGKPAVAQGGGVGEEYWDEKAAEGEEYAEVKGAKALVDL